MHCTILFSYITLFILLYQCVHYHQCNYLLVSKHFSFAECSIDFSSCNFLFQYFSSNICITIGVSSQHNFSLEYYFVKYYNCSKVVCSFKYSSNTAYSVFIIFWVVILGFGVFCKCMVCLSTLILFLWFYYFFTILSCAFIATLCNVGVALLCCMVLLFEVTVFSDNA